MLLTALSGKQQLKKICHTTNLTGTTPWQLAYESQLNAHADYIADHLVDDVAFAAWITNFANQNTVVIGPRLRTRFDSAGKDNIPMLVKALGKHAAAVAATPDSLGSTALHYAAKEGDATRLQVILDALANKAATVAATRNRNGLTPLHLAVRYGGAEMVLAILKALGKLAATVATQQDSQQDSEGWIPLHYATRYGGDRTVQALLKGVGDRAKMMAAMPSRDGWRPLHLALQHVNAPMVQALLAALGDQAQSMAAMPGIDGQTPLHLAIAHGDTDTVLAVLQVLDNLAATVATIPDNFGQTPLQCVLIANCYGHRNKDSFIATVSVLLKTLDDLAAKVIAMPDSTGWTPLHWLVYYADAAMVRIFLQALGDQAEMAVTIPALALDGHNYTPLTLAKSNEKYGDEITKVFFEVGLTSQFSLFDGLKTIINKGLNSTPPRPKVQVDDDNDDDDNETTAKNMKSASVDFKL